MEDIANRSMLPYAGSVTDLNRIKHALLDRNLLVLYINKETKETVNKAIDTSVLQ